MKAQIYCKPTDKGVHSFFLMAEGQEYYLFKQNYRKGVQSYFGRGIRVDEAYDFSKARKDSAIIRTLSKLPAHIRYIESEYGIAVLKQTVKKQDYYRRYGKIPA